MPTVQGAVCIGGFSPPSVNTGWTFWNGSLEVGDLVLEHRVICLGHQIWGPEWMLRLQDRRKADLQLQRHLLGHLLDVGQD